jgi:two-component system cell cycle sensor histidine kinase/response regulator CckA
MTSRPTTILCIDDEPEILRLREQQLEMYGFLVLTASSGTEGLQLLSDGQVVDLVLLDYVMPGMSGEELAKELKRLYPRVPIVLMSGFQDLPETLLRRVDGYVRKGQDPEVVIKTITRALIPGYE